MSQYGCRGGERNCATPRTIHVSRYENQTNPKDLRIAIQLRDNVRSIITRDANLIKISFENRFGVFNKNKIGLLTLVSRVRYGS